MSKSSIDTIQLGSESFGASSELVEIIDEILSQRANPTFAWDLAERWHRTHRNEALDFGRHRYQVAILKDGAKDLVIRKSTQCGVSELALIWALSCVDQGYNVLYVFPNETLRNQFSTERIAPSVHLTERYREMAAGAEFRVGAGKAAEATMLRQLGSATIALVGSHSKAAFRSFVADAAVIDELDECDQANLKHVPDRFGHSEYRHTWRLGNPSVEDFGIDKLFKAGDQKLWFIRCRHCGKRQSIDWFQNVVREVDENVFEPRSRTGEYAVVCRACDRPLDRLGPGEWVATYPDRDRSTYSISKLFSGAVPIPEIGERFEEGLFDLGALQVFYNSDLGLPYTPKGSKLTDDLIRRAVGDFPRSSTAEGGFAGVDVGTLLHYVVMDYQERVVAVGSCRDFEELDALDEAYRPTWVVDGRPEARAARSFADRLEAGRVWICDKYDAVPKAQLYTIDQANAIVRIDRTASMDASNGDILRRRILFPKDAESIEDQLGRKFFDHLTAPTRVYDPERRLHIWTKGIDHWRHALNFATIAREIRRELGGFFVMSAGRKGNV